MNVAANSTACTGPNSRVATTVAMLLAASCSPFRKSNASAIRIRPTSSGKASSCTDQTPRVNMAMGSFDLIVSSMVDNDTVYLVCDIFECIDDPLQMLVYFTIDDEF